MRQLKFFLVLICLQGLAVNIWFLQTRSEAENAVFLGLSVFRLVLLGAQLGLLLLFVGVTFWLWRSPARSAALLKKVDAWCLEQKQLASTLVSLVLLVIWLLAVVIFIVTMPVTGSFYESIQVIPIPFLKLVLGRVLPLFLWVIAFLLDICAFLMVRSRPHITSRDMWQWERIKAGPVVFLILTATLIHWLILGFRLMFLVDLPAWYWVITENPVTLRDSILAAAAFLLFGGICWLLFRRRMVRAGLVLVFLTGCLLQYGIGYLSGDGLQALNNRYFTRLHKTYVNKASQDTMPILQMVRNYDNVYGNRMFTSTKPPGLMMLFVGMDRIVNGNPSPFIPEERFERLSWVITMVFPILAMLLVFALYVFARRFLPGSTGLIGVIAPVLLIACPNVLLLSLYMDQAVYPITFLLGVGLTIMVIRRQSLWGAFALGAVLYAMIFFAFTMLPLYPLAGIYLLINYLSHRGKFKFRRQIELGLLMAAGTVLLYLLFQWVFNYDFFSRFATTIDINHRFDFYLRVHQTPPTVPEPLVVRIQQTVRAAWFNNLEYATAVGFPLFILFLIQGISLIVRLLKRMPRPGDDVLLALLLTFLVLNAAGTAQGEVARLWMFWLPIVLFFAAYEIERWVEKRPAVLWGILVLQFLTVLLTYHFQDLVM